MAPKKAAAAPAAAAAAAAAAPAAPAKSASTDAAKTTAPASSSHNADDANGKRPTPPDDKKHKEALAENRAAKEALDKRMDELKQKIAKLGKPGETYDPKIGELDEKMRKLDLQRKPLRDERNQLSGQVRDSTKTQTAGTREIDAVKRRLQFQTVAEFDQAIAEIEKRVQSGKLTMLGERQAMNEIAVLQKGRTQLQQLLEKTPAAVAASAAANPELDAKRAALEAKANDLDSMDTLYDQYRAELKALRDAKNADYETRKVLNEERDQLRAQADDLERKRREIDGEYRKTNEEWFRHQELEKEKKREAQRKLRAQLALEKKAAAEARRREERSIPKFETEISMCNALIAYLQKNYVGEAAADEGEDAAKREGAEAKKAPVEEGVTMLKKKSERVDVVFFQGKGKGTTSAPVTAAAGKSKGVAAPVRKDVKLPLGTMEDFWRLKVEVPATIADVPKAIDALRKCQDGWKKRQQDELLKAMQEEMEEEAAAAAAGGDAEEPVGEADAYADANANAEPAANGNADANADAEPAAEPAANGNAAAAEDEKEEGEID